jgi:hypothetical protein
MPYFVDPQEKVVVVLAPGANPSTLVRIDQAAATALRLKHGQPLSDSQIEALRSGSTEAMSSAFAHAPQAEWQPPRQPATSANPRSSINRRAFAVARSVEVISWIFLGLSVLGGIIIASRSEIDPNDMYSDSRTYPNISLGITIMIAGVFQALVVIMIAAYIQARTQDNTN